MNPKVDKYLENGCMRCKLGGTPACKVRRWTAELQMLRKIVLDSELTEEIKWGIPCYTFQKANVLIVSAFKAYCSISFFKGALLKGASDLLEKPGENTQGARLIKFTSVEQINKVNALVKELIAEAIAIEKAGLKVDFKKNPEPIPIELRQKLDQDPVFNKAFRALTPGRQRGYILHFSQPKQSKTRISRIEKCVQKILAGKGLSEM